MRTRREFAAKIKAAAFARCDGFCESCTRKLFTGDIFYDHAVADGLGGEPVLDNCQVLCRTCHDLKTCKHDVPLIAKGKRVRRRHIGINKRGSFATNRDGLFKRRMDGSVVRR